MTATECAICTIIEHYAYSKTPVHPNTYEQLKKHAEECPVYRQRYNYRENGMTNTSLGSAEIEHRFGFHKATIEGENATLPKHRDTRLLFREFAETMDSILPDGRAKSVFFTELENASMWAHKSIAELAPALDES